MSRLAPWFSALPLLILVGCILFVPPRDPVRIKPEPVGVSPEVLWRNPSLWKDQKIRCLLLARDYRVHGEWIFWYDGSPNEKPVISFQCENAPGDNTATIQLVGTCRGDLDNCVLVEDCTATAIPLRLP